MASRNLSVFFFGVAVALLVAASAGPVTQAGSGGLPGTWHGAFFHPGADYTSPSRSDVTLQVETGSTYTLKWGSRAETTGSIADEGNRVVLNDSSGAQITLMRSGDARYGVMTDTTTGRAATMNLAKEESAATQVAGVSARVCRTAGGSTPTAPVSRPPTRRPYGSRSVKHAAVCISRPSTARSRPGVFGPAEAGPAIARRGSAAL